jgi:hypothetical protein
MVTVQDNRSYSPDYGYYEEKTSTQDIPSLPMDLELYSQVNRFNAFRLILIEPFAKKEAFFGKFECL